MFLHVSSMFLQALEEAAANAAEEEKRRLQTQTELQDRYRMDLEREKMVGDLQSIITSELPVQLHSVVIYRRQTHTGSQRGFKKY